MSVEFKYCLCQRVLIKELALEGTIDALCLEIKGATYRVVYYCNATRRSEWMYEWELEKCKG